MGLENQCIPIKPSGNLISYDPDTNEWYPNNEGEIKILIYRLINCRKLSKEYIFGIDRSSMIHYVRPSVCPYVHNPIIFRTVKDTKKV